MRLGWKDAAAASLVATATAVTAAATGDWGWPLVGSIRGAAAVLLVLGLAACAIGGGGEGASEGEPPAFHGVLGGVSLFLHLTVGGLFVMALIAPSSGVLCAMTGTLVTLWLVGTAHHAVEGRARQHVA
jgi:hypothetical protein